MSNTSSPIDDDGARSQRALDAAEQPPFFLGLALALPLAALFWWALGLLLRLI